MSSKASDDDKSLYAWYNRLMGEFVREFYPDDYAKHWQEKNNQRDLFDEN